MADAKSKLAAGLAQPASRPMIKRGQGYHLSTDTVSEQPADQLLNTDPELPETEVSDSAITYHKTDQANTTANRTIAQSHNRTIAQDEILRISRGYRLREDVIKACKVVASSTGHDMYEVMEEALLQYLEKQYPEEFKRFIKIDVPIRSI